VSDLSGEDHKPLNAALGSEEGLEKYLNDGMATAK